MAAPNPDSAKVTGNDNGSDRAVERNEVPTMSTDKEAGPPTSTSDHSVADPHHMPLNYLGDEGLRDRVQARLNKKYTEEDKKVRKQWDEVTDWDELIDLNRAFLRGETEFTAYCSGPIYEETKPHLDSLLAMHDYGLLTFSSQPAREDTTITREDCPCCPYPDYYLERHRGYLSFLIPRLSGTISGEDVNIFINELANNDKFFTCILAEDGPCRRGGCKLRHCVGSTFPPDWATHMRKMSKSEKNVRNEEEYPRRFVEVDCACILQFFSSKVIDNTKPLIIHVLAKDWEEHDLAAYVVKAAQTAGLGLLFHEQLTEARKKAKKEGKHGHCHGHGAMDKYMEMIEAMEMMESMKRMGLAHGDDEDADEDGEEDGANDADEEIDRAAVPGGGIHFLTF